MFDPVDAFSRQFKPIEGGYLYYPSRKSGGKLVTDVEYAELLADWQGIAGRRGQWTIIGIISAVILGWITLSQSVTLPYWAEKLMMLGLVIGISGWFLWASLAPRRLVRGRPDFTPPRPAQAARRESRALLSWRFVIFALLLSGVALLRTLSSPDLTLHWWAWLIGSGALFVAYVCIALLKIMDRRS